MAEADRGRGHDPGRLITVASAVNSISGTTSSTQRVTTSRAHGFSACDLGSRHRFGSRPGQGRLDLVEQVRHAGQVGQHVIAVEPDQRRQLADHLDQLGADDQQQRVPAGQPAQPVQRHRQQGVEVQATKVGTQPAGPAEPVAVGHVGVEGRPDQVQPGAHRTGGGAAVPGRRGMTELVKARRDKGDREYREQQAREANASCAAKPRPRSNSTHLVTSTNATSTASTSSGLNSRANGAVTRRVSAGRTAPSESAVPAADSPCAPPARSRPAGRPGPVGAARRRSGYERRLR